MSYSTTWALHTRDHSRFVLDDTEAGKELLTDAEIDSAISALGWSEGTAQCALKLAAYWAKQGESLSQGTGGGTGLRVGWGKRVDHYRKLAEQLRSGAMSGNAPVSMGVLSVPDIAPLQTFETVNGTD